MAVWEVQVFKRSAIYPGSGGEWSNVYHVNETTIANARIAAVVAVDAERPLYGEAVEIFKYVVATGVGDLRQSVTEYVTLPGTRADLVDILPDWNVARIDWNAPPAVRSVRKYIRITLAESDVEGQTFNTDVQGILEDYATVIAEAGSFCNPDGVVIDAGGFRVQNRIAMRQTGWSRRARPGFHRAYVPNA
jgi:hypothetical protein